MFRDFWLLFGIMLTMKADMVRSNFLKFYPTISLFLGITLQSVVAAPVPTADQKHHTQVKLVADIQSIQPGSLFHLGLLMTMDPGWHTYWKNAGEAGLPPEIHWSLPKGISAGEILWPLPHKYNEGGEVITYGYERENMLIIPMNAAPDLQVGNTVTIKANASWLECEKLCIPGTGSSQILLPVKSGAQTPNNAKLFDRYRKMVPTPFTGDESFSLSVVTTDGAIELSINPTVGKSLVVVKDTVPDFYPEAFDNFDIGRTEVHAIPEGALLRVPVALFERGVAPALIRGVLVYQSLSGERKGGVVEVPLSKSFVSSLHVVGEIESEGSTEGLLDQTFKFEATGGGETPLYLYVVFAIVGGLLLNIMPCVLPVIGLKVFGLIKMGGEQSGEVKKMGFYFSLGILVSFLVLALFVVLLKAAGEQVGWGFHFQEPAFIIVMSSIVFAFGLSLFGVYEIRLPGRAMKGMGEAISKVGGEGKSSIASFSEGVFATILATPCTAPILGTALGFAFAQPGTIVFTIFFCVAFGMALPYLLLTLRPSWMKLLPKPGEWMVTAKQFMGFLMMATLIWLLYVLGKQLGMEAVIWTSAFLLTLGMACWLIGRFASLTATRTRYFSTWIVAILLIGGGYWLFLEPLLAAGSLLTNNVGKSNEPIGESEGIEWEPFTLPKLERYLGEGKAVFVDFTADWCLTCKVNEKAVLTDNDVIEKFRSSGIVAIKADWTTRNPDITRLLAKFERSGVPLYVIFPAGKPLEPIVLPEVITSSMVIEAIERATNQNTTLGSQ